MAVGLLVISEAAARGVVPQVGRHWAYWDEFAAVKFEGYATASARDRAPDVVVVGDSTGARNVDPRALERAMGRGSAYNLAWPGNFPLAFKVNTLPLLREARSVPRVVVVSFNPGGFTDSESIRRSEAGILSAPCCRHATGRAGIEDFVYLLRLRKALPFIRDQWRPYADFQKMRDSKGFLVPRGKGEGPQAGGGDAAGAERRAAGRPRMSPERMSVIRDVVTLGRQRHFKVVVVVPPQGDARRDEAYDPYVAALRHIRTQVDFDVLDWRAPPFLQAGDFYDYFHLSEHGARVYSDHLASVIVPLLNAE